MAKRVFLIGDGLYWATALRETGGEVKVYTKHLVLTQASKSHRRVLLAPAVPVDSVD